MGLELKQIVIAVQLIMQIGCIIYAIRAYYDENSNGLATFWWWLSFGYFFQIGFRTFNMLVQGFGMTGVPVILGYIVMPTCVSACFLTGVYKGFHYFKKRNKTIKDLSAKLDSLETNHRKIR